MEYTELNCIANIVSGYAIPSCDMTNEGTAIIKITNIREDGTLDLVNTARYNKPITDKLKKFLLSEKDIVVCMTGATIGKVARILKIDQDYIVNQRVAIIRAKNPELQDFVFQILTLPTFRKYVEIVGYGAAQPNISANAIGKYKFLNSSDIFIQRRIASILSAYDNLIENNNRRIRLLEQMAENLYKEWFVRFRFPGHEKVEMENGLPKGWKYEDLFSVATVSYGYAFKSELFCDNSSLNAVVRIRDIQDNHTDTYTSESCDEKYLIKKNAVLIGMDGIFHMCLWNGDKAYLNQRVVMLNSKYEHICNYYLFMAIHAQVKFWEQVIAGTTVAHLGDKHLRKMKVLIPNENILERANSFLESIMNERNKLFKQNQLLTRQRDLLLPRLMSGKLEVNA